MEIFLGCAAGFVLWFVIRYFIAGFYIIDQNQRALITTFGRADRLGEATTLDLPLAEALVPDEQERYCYPQVRVVQPGFYWKWPWQQVHRVSIATATMNMAYDPDEPQANKGGTILVLDASLITGIDPPPEVESALAAINTAHNQVSSDISLAQAAADQKIVQSKRAVEIETLKAQAEIEPLERMATQLESLKQNGSGVLKAYVRNVRMSLFGRSEQAFVEVDS